MFSIHQKHPAPNVIVSMLIVNFPLVIMVFEICLFSLKTFRRPKLYLSNVALSHLDVYMFLRQLSSIYGWSNQNGASYFEIAVNIGGDG